MTNTERTAMEVAQEDKRITAIILGYTSSEYANLLSAQNDLLDEIMEMAAQLEPGEDHIIAHPDMPLAIQVRRVRGEQAPINPAANPLSRRGTLFATMPSQAAE